MKLLIPIGALMCLLLGGCAESPFSLGGNDLGSVEPGQPLEAHLNITNDADKPAILTGLDGACGVKVVNKHNGVLGAKESVDLTLNSVASRIPGPGGFQLEVGMEVEGQKKVKTYLFKYVVASRPYLSVNEVWLDSASNSVDVMGVNDDQQVVFEGDPALKVEIVGHHITFSDDKSNPDPAPSDAKVSVRRGSEVFAQLPIKISRGQKLGQPVVWPASAWVTQDSKCSLTLSGKGDYEISLSPAGSLVSSVEENKLTLKPDGGYKGLVTVQVMDHKSGQTGECQVWVE